MSPVESSAATAAADAPKLLFVEHDVLLRTAMASYLRECGYLVVEATSVEEAVDLLRLRAAEFDIVFAAIESPGAMDGFALSHWVREHAPQLHVVLAGTVAKAARVAGDLCEQGPHLSKPYHPQSLLDWIKRLRALKS